MMNVTHTKLSNGVRVISSSIPHVESATMGIWVGTGSRNEPGRLSGISHFIEHLLFKGTKTRSSKSISQAIEGKGGYLNAFTQEENTCYYSRVVHDQLGKALDVLSDMYLHPRLDSTEIKKERGVILEEIMMYNDQPHHVVQDLLTDSLWKNHPLGIPIIGSPATLQKMTKKDIVDYKTKHYVPSNTLFAFAGRIDHNACVEMVDKLTGKLKAHNPGTCRKVTADTGQQAIALKAKTIEQSHMALGIRLFGRQDKRRYTLRILNTILGENMSSRLFQTVREKHGLAYSVHSSCHLFKDSGAFVVSAGLDRSRTEKAILLILKELACLKDRPVGGMELKRAKDYVIGQLRLSMESTTHHMMWIGDNIMSHGRFISPEKAMASLSSVTAEDIQKLARSVLRKSKTSLAIVAPDLTDNDKGRYQDMVDSIL